MDDTDKMCVYEGYIKARDCRQETLVKYEAHRYSSTNEWINAAIAIRAVHHFPFRQLSFFNILQGVL